MTETSPAPRATESVRKKTTPSPTSKNPVATDASGAPKGKDVDTFHLSCRPRVWPD